MRAIFKKIKNRFLRITVVVLLAVVIFVCVVIAFISPIAKYVIEHNSVKYTGRKVDMSWLYLNPFTGHFHAHNFTVYEQHSNDKFIAIRDFSFNVSLRGLYKQTYDFYSVTLDNLVVYVVQNKTVFNFNDLLALDSTSTPGKKSAPIHYYVRDIELLNSLVDYKETSIPVHYFVTKLNVKCPTIQWDTDSSSFNYDFTFLDNSGLVKGLFKMNYKTLDYEMKPVFSKFDLKSLEQYIKEIANYGSFKAYLNADIDAKGNFNSAKDLVTTGKLEISDFHFGKSANEDYLRFSKLLLDAELLSPLNKKFYFNTIVLDSFFVKYEMYDSLDNLSHMFGVGGTNVTQAQTANYSQNIIFQIAHYISEVASEVVNSQYRAKEFQVTNAKLLFNDYSLAEKFSVTATPIVITAHNIDTRSKRLYVTLNTKTNPFGRLDISFDVNPVDFGDFNLAYNFRDFPLPLFNPYAVTYTSFPFDRGILAMDGQWHVVNKQINSTNHIAIKNARLADRIKYKDETKLPMRVAMFFVRDRHRQIDVQIPITADLNKPKMGFKREIIKAIKNALVKLPTTPLRGIELAKVKKDEGYLEMDWNLRQAEMDNHQEHQLKNITRYMFFHPNTQVTIRPFYFEEKEKEMILFFEAKKVFYATKNHLWVNKLTKDDSINICRISNKDSVFLHYLDHIPGALKEFTAQGKCLLIISQARVDALYTALKVNRKNEVLAYFKDRKVSDRIKFDSGIVDTPTIGFSHYMFYYKGDQPESDAQ